MHVGSVHLNVSAAKAHRILSPGHGSRHLRLHLSRPVRTCPSNTLASDMLTTMRSVPSLSLRRFTATVESLVIDGIAAFLPHHLDHLLAAYDAAAVLAQSPRSIICSALFEFQFLAVCSISPVVEVKDESVLFEAAVTAVAEFWLGRHPCSQGHGCEPTCYVDGLHRLLGSSISLLCTLRYDHERHVQRSSKLLYEFDHVRSARRSARKYRFHVLRSQHLPGFVNAAASAECESVLDQRMVPSC